LNHVIKYKENVAYPKLNKDTEKKKYMEQKPLTYTFHYWGSFVLDPARTG